MDIVETFLEEIFDFKVPASKYVDTVSGSLKLSLVLQDPAVKTGILFRSLWYTTFGIYPSRQTTAVFLMKASCDGSIDVQQFIQFLSVVLPFMNNAMSFDTEKLTASVQTITSAITTPGYIKEHLVQKFCLRFGVYPKDVDAKQGLFQVYKSCVLHVAGLKRVKEIDEALGKLTKMSPVGCPDKVQSLSEYYEVSEKMVRHYDLCRFNPFNSSYNGAPFSTDSRQTVFDAINGTASADPTFFRFLWGAHAIYWESGDLGKGNARLNTLMLAMNNRSTKLNIVLFKDRESLFDPMKLDFYYFTYHVMHPILMHAVPHVASCFVLISDSVNPCVPSISSKPEMGIYYCLPSGNNKDSTIIDKQHAYSRYMCHQHDVKRMREMVSDKKVYLIVEDDGKQATSLSLVHNMEFAEHQWNAHVTMPCPYLALSNNNYHPSFNVLLFDQFLAKYHADNERVIRTAATTQYNSKSRRDNAVVLIDNRPNIFSLIALVFTLSNLQKNLWDVVVVCNDKSYTFFHKYLGDKVKYIRDIYLPSQKFSIDMYNDLLKSEDFWARFADYDKTLFVQDDGMLLKSGLEDKYLVFDYVGAPWKKEWASQDPNKFIRENINTELVGNGGLSLRSPKCMMHICKKFSGLTKQLHYDKVQQQPEDVFFSCFAKREGFKMPSYDVARGFATEQVVSNGSLGFHKPWPYMDVVTMEAYFNSYLKTPLFD
jgi:hypothetical protein